MIFNLPEHDLTTQGLELLRPAWAHVDLDALTRNLARLKDAVGSAQIAAVVKADAYGHGAVHTARALERAGVDLLAVALPEEGAQLRRAGTRTPILVLGAHLPPQIPLFIEFDLMPTISTRSQLAAWCSRTGATGAREATRAQAFHLKVDTGMRRLGFSIDELPAVLDQIRRAKSLELAGVLSHFAASNEPQAQINVVQEKEWRAIEELLTAQEQDHVVRHIANSAAALHRPWSCLDMVRIGLALYGVDPVGVAGLGDSADPANHSGALEAVMSVKARIVAVRQVAAGEGVGYGHRWRAQRDSRVGLLPLGYADGYSWRLGSRAQALAGGHRVEVIGNISMDMTAIDLTDSEQVEGDEVTLLGGSGNMSISAFELAEWAGTIPYEILASFGLRLPRVYVRDGREVAVSGRLVADAQG
ncbi:MAG: alanine racemase [Acidobacteria bacterium]|nr:alanine racemase [Acidobacteriota bacterium]